LASTTRHSSSGKRWTGGATTSRFLMSPRYGRKHRLPMVEGPDARTNVPNSGAEWNSHCGSSWITLMSSKPCSGCVAGEPGGKRPTCSGGGCPARAQLGVRFPLGAHVRGLAVRNGEPSSGLALHPNDEPRRNVSRQGVAKGRVHVLKTALLVHHRRPSLRVQSEDLSEVLPCAHDGSDDNIPAFPHAAAALIRNT
jgi:hypothetical protein